MDGERKHLNTQPPEPPDMRRRIMMYPMQMIGMGVILLIPLLALFGFFGEIRAEADTSSAAFSLHVDYPRSYRFRVHNPLTVTVRNTSDQAFEIVTVSFSTSYLSPFADSQFNPDLSRITADAYEVDLENVQPGEARIVTVVLEGQEYGQHNGTVAVAAPNVEPVQLSIGTFVFP